jgi:hypothetical protein
MATTEPTDRDVTRRRIAAAALGVLAAGIVVVVVLSLTRPPQMGVDEDAFRTVDALYTAVRMHDTARLGQCEERLRAYRQAGKLPQDAADYLDGVIDRARDGQWKAATERLYEFMLAQRREGGEGRGQKAVGRTQ